MSQKTLSKTARSTLTFVFPLFFLMALSWSLAAEDDEGKEIYKSKCVSCHGADGTGDTKAGKMLKSPDLTKKPWKHGTSQAEVEKVIREGAGKMRPYKEKLTAAEIAWVAKYTRRLCKIEE